MASSYYLTHKAQEVGYHPEMILAGRRLNDNMAGYVAERVAQLMGKKSLLVNRARVLVMGIAFKENCPDVRNSKVVDLIHSLEKFGATVDVWDPWVDPKHVKHEYGITPIKKPRAHAYDAVVMAVSHHQFKTMGIRGVKKLMKRKNVLFDIKHVFKAKDVDGEAVARGDECRTYFNFRPPMAVINRFSRGGTGHSNPGLNTQNG